MFQCHEYNIFNRQNSFRAKVRGRWPVKSLSLLIKREENKLLQFCCCAAINLQTVKHPKRNIELCTGWKGTETWQARWASGIWQRRRMSLFSYLLIKLNVSTWQLDQHGYCQKLHTRMKKMNNRVVLINKCTFTQLIAALKNPLR